MARQEVEHLSLREPVPTDHRGDLLSLVEIDFFVFVFSILSLLPHYPHGAVD